MDDPVARAVGRISEGDLRVDLARLARPRHHRASPLGLEAAARHAEVTLAAAGCSVRRVPVAHEGVAADIVVGERPGDAPEWVLVSAHYDAVAGSDGADDDASGVA